MCAMTDRVITSLDSGVAHVELARPDKLNALDLAMFEALIATGEQLAGDNRVRAVVVSGQGRSFCAGLDFASFAALGEESNARMFERSESSVANRAQRAAWVWRELPVPVIAAVHGHAFGGGLQVALAADIRIVAPDAELSVMEVEWGLVPDMTGTQTLRGLVRLDVAFELTFTGRRVSGTEAVALGLATRVSDDPLDAARALARGIAQKSPDAVRAAKRLLCAAWTGSFAEGLELEAREQRSLIGTRNQLEAVQARIGRRVPHFEDPE
jgi:enoyl-CoA hydratase/carnithine racemase